MKVIKNKLVLPVLAIITTVLLLVFTDFSGRGYYYLSLAMVFLSILAFYLKFENRRPKARELVLIAVLIAIGVAGRVAFYMIPQFKAIIAIIIISGIALGAESGFMIGSLTAFTSNLFFGQGPWTPWQMLCMGIIGFMAGVVFHKGRVLPAKRSYVCIFGTVSVLVVYGGIMDPASVLMFQPEFTWGALIMSYVAGFWFNVIHSAATCLFLYLLTEPMLKKLTRVQTKYGLEL